MASALSSGMSFNQSGVNLLVGSSRSQGKPSGDEESDTKRLESTQEKVAFIADLSRSKEEKSASVLMLSKDGGVSESISAANYQAMAQDLISQPFQKTEEAQTLFFSQQYGQQSAITYSSEAVVGGGTSVDEKSQVVDEVEEQPGSKATNAFLDYMEKTPEERYFEKFLEKEGLTKEQFEALPPEERKSLLKEFEEEMKERAETFGAASIVV